MVAPELPIRSPDRAATDKRPMAVDSRLRGVPRALAAWAPRSIVVRNTRVVNGPLRCCSIGAPGTAINAKN